MLTKTAGSRNNALFEEQRKQPDRQHVIASDSNAATIRVPFPGTMGSLRYSTTSQSFASAS